VLRCRIIFACPVSGFAQLVFILSQGLYAYTLFHLSAFNSLLWLWWRRRGGAQEDPRRARGKVGKRKSSEDVVGGEASTVNKHVGKWASFFFVPALLKQRLQVMT
jgi:hypothetical protein